ncbi:OmpA family protein [Flavobacterium sp. Fl-318]|uniref:OmpA family protein n=1 Tax=Flavobacterium cupriresistens TaxID=2893885 RepID=A0ABU4RGG9_9FLAO|nr:MULTISPECIES: OmpA family protein [unclassified Flavobacterium]MDX6191678.1 OmpA family protein [Flavobacterium sp. Fl-318]UFH41622.1 OmpA family protein [Flavobacterium sp. F-323]
MKIKNILYTGFIVLFAVNGTAQKASLRKADKNYTEYAYIDAITIYEEVAAKGYKDEQMFQRLGNAYYFNGELSKATKWYEALFAVNDQQDPEYYYRYAQTLKATENYTKADQMLEIFNQKKNIDKRAMLFESNKNYLEQIKLNSGRFEIADAGINSTSSDYGSAFLNDKLVFASARDTGVVARKRFKWTNRAFTNLYTATLNSDGTLGEPERFTKKINSKFNESTPVFSKDGTTMYFTRNNFLKGKRGRDDKKNTLLKLYKANLVKEEWTNLTELPFNSDQYSVAHPALSVDEKTLYFASDMPGTLGQSDLYSVTINADGTFGLPQNLGASVNTEGRETFPFVSGDNELYFSSDGRPGLGGLDVFVSKINADKTFGEVLNIGAPVNTSQDDFDFVMNNESRIGFFSSNREGGKGYDDIYRFTETKKLIRKQSLGGVVTDSEDNKGLENVKVNLLDDNFQVMGEALTGVGGTYTFEVDADKVYYIRATKEAYETKEIPVSVDKSTGKINAAVPLFRRIKSIEKGTDLAKTLDIPIIYFDLDKSVITKAAAFELEKVVAVMRKYPEMKIDVRSHTDSRQMARYNRTLSDKRAKATIKWLAQNGIDSKRLSGKGYGESQLVNQCSDGIVCTEAEHQLNRRSEFIIVSME